MKIFLSLRVTADAEGGLKNRAHLRPVLQGFGGGQPPTSTRRVYTGALLAATAAVNAALTTIIRVDINQTYHNFPKTLAISIWISYNTIDNLTDGSLCYRLRGRYNLRPIT